MNMASFSNDSSGQDGLVTKAEGKRILIVDDEADLNTICQMALEDAGFEVRTYTNPVLALSDFKPSLFDLVILDIKMPQMDGFELYSKLKKIDRHVKIYFLTASEEYYEQYRRQEYDSIDKDLFILKPVSNQQLIEKINKFLFAKE